jgi:hypothetical protein
VHPRYLSPVLRAVRHTRVEPHLGQVCSAVGAFFSNKEAICWFGVVLSIKALEAFSSMNAANPCFTIFSAFKINF